MIVIHPSPLELQRFAEHAVNEPSARVAVHLQKCAKCRELVMASREIAAEVRRLPMHTPSSSTLDRILASRQAGRRFILPLDDAPRNESHLLRLTLRIAAVILVMASVALFVRLPSRPSGTSDDADVSSMTSLFVFGGVASAYAQTARAIPAVVSSLPGRTLAPMALSFRREWINPARMSERRTEGYATLSVLPRRLGADSVWLINNSWTGLKGTPEVDNARTVSESLYVSRGSLRPIARKVHVTPYRRFPGINISQRFDGDSVLGEMSLKDMATRRPIAADVASFRNGLVPSEVLGPVLLMGVALNPTWHATLGLLGWSVVPTDVIHPFAMRVVGSERITVPAGTFDCWKLAVTYTGHTRFVWIRKSDHIGVLSRDETPGSAGSREVVLVAETHSPPSTGQE